VPIGGSRTFAVGDRLRLSLNASKLASAYRFELVPTQGIVTGSIAEAIVLGQTGPFSLVAQYTAAGSAPVQCPLIAALNVSATQLCDQIHAEFSLAASAAAGARSSLTATLTSPAGAAVSLVATPLDSTVRVPLLSQRGSTSTTGSVTLPSTGQWSVTVGIGKEQCTKLSQTLIVECLNGFIDAQGRCICPDGYANMQGQCQVMRHRDPCEDATIRNSVAGTLPRGTASVTLGTTLSVSVKADAAADAANTSYKTLLIPKQGTEVHDLARDFGPNRTGTFSLDMEYGPVGGTPKRCTLLSSLTVKCRSGEQEVDGQCRAVARSACDLASVDVALTEDPARGAWSLVKATLQLPVGMSASLVATPLQSAVEVPLSQSGQLSTWEGSVSLPSTGAWALKLSVGREQCYGTVRNVTCTAGFVDDNAGRCICPAGHENEGGTCVRVQQQVDVCQLASVRSSSNDTIRLERGDAVPLRLGTGLSVSFTVAAAVIGYEALLVPLQGTETFDTTQEIVPQRSGSFALKLRKANSTQECSLIPRLDVKCGEGEQEVDRQCRPRPKCAVTEGFWEDTTTVDGTAKCRKRPRIAAKAASDKLDVVLAKKSSAPDTRRTVEVRLVSGDADAGAMVDWTASSSSDWLVLEGSSAGTVSSLNPVAVISVVVRGSNQSDTAASGPLRAQLKVRSSMRGRHDLFENGTGSLEVVVEVAIEAAASLTEADVRVQTKDGENLAQSSKVSAGDTLAVTASAFDYERLKISRPALQILAELSTGTRNETVPLQHLDGNTYRAELPGSWLEVPGDYILRIHGVEFRFSVTQPNQNLYVAAGIGAVRARHACCLARCRKELACLRSCSSWY
jgi:hypothetical protein